MTNAGAPTLFSFVCLTHNAVAHLRKDIKLVHGGLAPKPAVANYTLSETSATATEAAAKDVSTDHSELELKPTADFQVTAKGFGLAC